MVVLLLYGLFLIIYGCFETTITMFDPLLGDFHVQIS